MALVATGKGGLKMGGRGSAGGKGGGFGGIENEIVSDFAETVKYGGYTAAKLKSSATFVQSVSDAISKKAFMQDKEITTKQLNKITNRVIDKLGAKSQKVTKETEEQRKTREAKEYFKQNYNQNKPKREITSSTYERAQKRLNRDLDNWLGIKK